MTADFQVHEVQRAGRKLGTVHRPISIEAALQALLEDPTARPLAGGTDLLLDLQRGEAGPPVNVVDVSAIDGFTSVTDEGDHFRLAGGVRHNQVIQHEGLVRSALPLAQACLEVGSPQLRNRATIAGNLATASPANDTISALMALGAKVEISSLTDRVVSRTVDVEGFFTGFRQTVLVSGDLITAIIVPKLAANQRGIWVKLGLRRAQAISVVHAGLVLSFAGDLGSTGATGLEVEHTRLAIGSVAPTVVMVEEFADALVGKSLTTEVITSSASKAAAAVTPISDGRATSEYRLDGVAVLLERSLAAIAAGTQASMWPDAPPTLSSPDQLESIATSPRPVVLTDSPITVEVNGQSHTAPSGGAVLLDWVRGPAGATGMKEGCAEGECGACTMIVNGAAVMSCLVPAAQVDGAAIVTVEGLDHPIQRAFVDEFAVQCGFCIPGFLVSSARLLDEVAAPTDQQIAHALSGNLCRCTGYYPIIDAVHAAAVTIRDSRV